MFDYICDYENVYDIYNITPVDIKIYYENKTPYLDYVGEAIASDNTKMTIHIPKIALDFHHFHCERKGTRYYDGTILNFETRAVLEDKKSITFQIVEREMTKEQVEKELGYKVKIKEN